jgi:hypothetical protein
MSLTSDERNNRAHVMTQGPHEPDGGGQSDECGKLFPPKEVCMTKTPSDKADVIARAKAAGLQKALERFPNEVSAAANAAAQARNAFVAPGNAAVEPWPPMRTRVGL